MNLLKYIMDGIQLISSWSWGESKNSGLQEAVPSLARYPGPKWQEVRRRNPGQTIDWQSHADG
jgi:hypothetical protein